MTSQQHLCYLSRLVFSINFHHDLSTQALAPPCFSLSMKCSCRHPHGLLLYFPFKTLLRCDFINGTLYTPSSLPPAAHHHVLHHVYDLIIYLFSVCSHYNGSPMKGECLYVLFIALCLTFKTLPGTQ